MRTRPTKLEGIAFAWQGKAELRRIADACDGRTDRALMLAVYLALTWFASDKRAPTFTESITRIAERAGVSYRKAAGVLSFLARLDVIGIRGNVIEGTKERGPNTYTLGTACTTSGTGCQRLGTEENRSVPRLLEESPEESPEEIAPDGASESSKHSKPPRKPIKPRERNAVLDALVSVDGSDPVQVTSPAWGAAAKALKDIREVDPDVTTEEIQRRASNYRLHMPDAAISATALAKHWAKCDRLPTKPLSQSARIYTPL